MKKPAVPKINLLPKDPFLATPIGRFLQWALSVGRYLVIFTELVVVLSFATRFSLDRRITDLNGAIFQKKIIISSYGSLEQDVRDAQKKIEAYAQVEQQQNLADIFPVLSQITPPDVQMKELNVQPGGVAMAGIAKSQAALNTLITNVQVTPQLSDISVERLETDRDQPGFAFRIRATIKK